MFNLPSYERGRAARKILPLGRRFRFEVRSPELGFVVLVLDRNYVRKSYIPCKKKLKEMKEIVIVLPKYLQLHCLPPYFLRRTTKRRCSLTH